MVERSQYAWLQLTTGGCLYKMLLNLNLTTTTTIARCGVYLENWAVAVQPPQINVSKQVMIQTFRNTRAILLK